MAGDVEVRNVSGTCKVGGSDYGVTGLQVNFGINNWPSFGIEVAINATKSASADNVTADMVKDQLAAWQKSILGSSGLDVSLNVRVDGKPVARLQDGKATSVSMTVGVGTLRATLNAVPDYAEVDALDLSIYRTASKDMEVFSDLLESANPSKSVNSVVKKFASTLMDRSDLVLSTFDDDDAGQACKKAFMRQHAVNMRVKKYFDELLDASDDLGNAWSLRSLLDAGAVSYTGQFGAQLLSLLTRSNGSFLSTICSLANMFRAIYVPGMDSIGKLVPKSVMVQAPKDKAWTTVSMSGNAYGSSQLPVAGVMLVLPDHTGQDDIEPGDQKGQVVTYDNPGSPKYGRTHRITPPSWLPARLAMPCRVSKKGKAPSRKGASPSDIGNEVSSTIREFRKKPRPWSDLLREWCRQELIDQLFGNYVTAIVSTTHELSCGKRVRHDLGSGFLCQTSMQMTIGRGTGTLRTVYTCTHSVYDESVLSALQ